jgi:thymidylate kinase
MIRSFPDAFWVALAEIEGSVLWCDEDGSEGYFLLPAITGAERLLNGVLGPLLWHVRRAHRLELAYRGRRVHLLDRLEWRGTKLGDAAAMSGGGAVGPPGVRVVPVSEAAPSLWLLRLLIGADVSDKMRDAVMDAARLNEARTFALLANAAGGPWAARLMSIARDGTIAQPSLVRALRRAVLWRGMVQARATAAGCWLDWCDEIALWRRPPVGWVALIGPDGIGKSSVQAGIQARLSREFCGSLAMHWRPSIFRRSESVDSEVVRQPHAAKPRRSLVSALKLAFLSLDWVCGNLLLLLPARVAGRLVVFDRHFVDILVDPRRYRYGGPVWLATLVAGLVPSPDLWIVLDGAPELIRARKDEVAIEDLTRLRARYLQLAETLENAYIVDAAVALDAVVDRVVELLLDTASQRTKSESRRRSRIGRNYRSA